MNPLFRPMSSCVFTIDSPLSIRTLADSQVGKSLPDAVTLMTFTGGGPTDEFMDSCIIPLLYLILPDRIHITAFFYNGKSCKTNK